jgi:hypothetical protein
MFTRLFVFPLWAIAGVTALAAARPIGAFASEVPKPPGAQAAVARHLGTIKAIKGNTLTLSADEGTDLEVVVSDTTRIVRVEPGQKDLKGATAMLLKDLQVGDRILVRGQPSADAKTFMASGIIAMKHSDVEAKKQQEREDWQKHGIGGLVSSVDPSTGTIKVGVGAAGTTTEVAVQVSKSTIIRRYAPDSVKFDDAKLGTLEEIKAGDQLRARGTRSADGSEFTAAEIVTGAFRNIAGTISSIDAATNTVSVMDLIKKQPVAVKISAESQVRKLPPEMAQRIAARLKAAAGGNAPGAPAGTSGAGARGQSSTPTSPAGGGNAAPGARQGADLQQVLNRLPPTTIAELQKGDAVMIVSTEGTASGQVTAITLLAGVEPILTASPQGAQGMALSPWSLGAEGAGGGDTNQ